MSFAFRHRDDVAGHADGFFAIDNELRLSGFEAENFILHEMNVLEGNVAAGRNDPFETISLGARRDGPKSLFRNRVGQGLK